MSEQFEGYEVEDPLSAALRVALTVKNSDGYDELTSAIAHRYALLGDFDRAVEVADSMYDPYLMEKTLGEIAVMLAAADRGDDAFELVGSLEDFSHQATATSQIAIAYATAGEFDRAIEVAAGMDDNASTLAEVAQQCVVHENLERAMRVVEMLDFPLYIAWARIRIAEHLAKAGQRDDAIDMLKQALVETDQIEPDDEKVSTISEIAVRLAEVEETEQAWELFTAALKVATNAEKIYRDAAYSHISAGLARLKQYDRAIKIAEKIDDVYQATTTLIGLAVIEHEDESRQAEAIHLLSDAFDLIAEVVPDTQRNDAQRNNLLTVIAVRYADFGDRDRALLTAQHLAANEEQYNALTSLTVRFAQGGKYEDATMSARNIKDDSVQANALLRASRIAIAADAKEQGIEFLLEASNLVEKLERPADRVHILMGLAIAYHEAEETVRTSTLFTDALADTKTITSAFQKASALLSIAEACSKTEYEFNEEFKEMLWQLSAV